MKKDKVEAGNLKINEVIIYFKNRKANNHNMSDDGNI